MRMSVAPRHVRVAGNEGTPRFPTAWVVLALLLLLVVSGLSAAPEAAPQTAGSDTIAAGHAGKVSSPGPAAQPMVRANFLPSRLPSVSGFHSQVNVSTTSPVHASGGPVAAPSNSPSTVTDATGVVYTTWAANVSGTWRIYFSKSTDGSTFTAPVLIDPTPTSGDEDVSPNIAVSGSGSTAKVVVVYQVMVSYTIASGGFYDFVLSTNGGGTWPSAVTGSYISDPYSNIVSPVAAWDSAGNLIVAFWASTTTGTGDTNLAVDLWTGGTAYSTSYTGPALVYEFYPTIALACSSTVASCGIEISVTNSGGTLNYAELYYSTNQFSTFTTHKVLSTAAFSSSANYATEVVDEAGVSYGSGYNATVAFLYNVGSDASPTYNVNTTYTSTGWTSTTKGGYPAGASGTGLGAVAVSVSSGNDPYVFYCAVGGTPMVTWALSPGGAYLTAIAVTKSPSDATSLAVTTAVAPFRVDLVYLNASKSTLPQVYYSSLVGLSATASASPTTVDLGQNVSFTSSINGGLAAYSDSWNFGGACSPSCPSTLPNASVNYTTTGVYTAKLTVTDGIGETVTVSAPAVTVNARPGISLAPVNATIDAGMSSNATATASGGTLPYGAYAFYRNGVVSQSGSQTWFNTTFPTAGVFYVNATVTDALGVTSSAASSVITVNPLPSITAFTATPATMALGNSSTLSVTTAGGTAPFTYAYSGLPTGCTTASSPTLTCTPTVNGSFRINVTATDRFGRSVTSNTTLDVTPAIPPLAVSAFTASPSSFTQGGTTYLNVTASGGVTPYTYVYSSLPAGCNSANVTSLACTPTANGTFAVTVTVTDVQGHVASRNVSFTVTPVVIPPISIASFTASPAAFLLGGTTDLNVSASGGQGPLSYSYSGLPAGCSSQNLSSLACTPSGVGNSTVTVTVSDAHGRSATQTTSFSVGSPPVPLSITSFAATPSSFVVGNSTTFLAKVSGGTPSYSYAYSNTLPGCVPINSNTWACTPSTAGNYTVTLTVTDQASHTATAEANLTVSPVPLPPKPSISAFTAAPNPVTLGGKVWFNASATGGTPAYSYAYAGLPSGCSSIDTSTFSCTPTKAGNYSIGLTVTDSRSQTAQATAALEVRAAVVPTPLTVSLGANQTHVKVGELFKLTSQASGGHGPYTYLYAINGTNQSSSPSTDSWTLNLTHPGTYSFTVWAEDSVHAKAQSTSVTVTVDALQTNVTPSGAFPWWMLLVAIAIAGLILLIFYVHNRRSRSKRPEETGVAEEALAGTAVVAGGASVAGSPTADDLGLPSGAGYVAEPVAPVAPVPPRVPVAAGPHSRSTGETEEPLTSCPSCSGPLGSDLSCRTCGRNWSEGGIALGAAAVAPLPPAPPVAPTALTTCPQCGSHLGPDLACYQCGVSWVPEAGAHAEPPPPAPAATDAEATVSTPPEPVAEPAAVAQAPPAPAPAPQPEVAPPVEPPRTPPTPKEEPRAPVPDVPSPPTAPESSSPAKSLPTRACFVCGSLLVGNYCPVCETHWDEEEAH